MQESSTVSPSSVDCRIGSLEMLISKICTYIKVDCRIGSLESKRTYPFLMRRVDCRIGSLEM